MCVDTTPLSKAAQGPGAPRWLHMVFSVVCQGGVWGARQEKHPLEMALAPLEHLCSQEGMQSDQH